MTDLQRYMADRRDTVAALACAAFDLRTRIAELHGIRHMLLKEHARCQPAPANRRRATVPSDDLIECGHFLTNHIAQLEEAERQLLASKLAAISNQQQEPSHAG